MDWSHPESGVSCVIIKGAGGKAFCAGGDVKSVVQTMSKDTSGPMRFFTVEYTNNMAISRLPIPYIALIDGIVMGGGVGVSIHGPFRVATDRTVFAMPEVSIGLFPDVGASFFLHALPGQLGRYLGLTGSRLTGVDVKAAGLATHCVHHSCLAELEAAIQLLGQGARDLAQLNDLLCSFEQSHPPHSQQQQQHPAGSASASTSRSPAADMPSSLSWKLPLINQHFGHSSLQEVYSSLEVALASGGAGDVAGAAGGAGTAGGLDDRSRQFLADALRALQRSSPLSQCITWEMLRRGAHLGLEACLAMELGMVAHFVQGHADFAEGVRAMLVDKGDTPRWMYASVADVPPQAVARVFEPQPGVRLLIRPALSVTAKM